MDKLTWGDINKQLQNTEKDIDILAYYRKSAKSDIQALELVEMWGSLTAVKQEEDIETITDRINTVGDLLKFIEDKNYDGGYLAKFSIYLNGYTTTSFHIYRIYSYENEVILDLGF